jgi:hypothetical protein
MWSNSTVSVHRTDCFPLSHKPKVSFVAYPDSFHSFICWCYLLQKTLLISMFLKLFLCAAEPSNNDNFMLSKILYFTLVHLPLTVMIGYCVNMWLGIICESRALSTVLWVWMGKISCSVTHWLVSLNPPFGLGWTSPYVESLLTL